MLTARYDISDTAWYFEFNDLKEFDIAFSDGENFEFVFDNLSFGWSCKVNGQPFQTKSYPPPGVFYLEANADYRHHETLDLEPEDQVEISLWAVNGGIRKTGKISFSAPLPPQPYPSWIWEDGDWVAPVPYPDESQEYEWDEEGQQWATVDPNGEQGDS